MPRGKANSPDSLRQQLSGLRQFTQAEIEKRVAAWPEKPTKEPPTFKPLGRLALGSDGRLYFVRPRRQPIRLA